MPSGVVFTSRSSSASWASRSSQARGCSWGAQPAQLRQKPSSASGRRAATSIRPTPSSTRPATTARALPPQPSTSARAPAQAAGPSRRRGATKPSTSVLLPSQPPSPWGTRVFTAPSRSARGVSCRHRAVTACLWGRVTFRPRQSIAASPRTTLSSSRAGAGRARYTQSRPRAARAALCMAGESEWRTGSPSTPTRAVWPEMGWAMARGGLLGRTVEPCSALFGNHTSPGTGPSVEDASTDISS